MRTKSFIDELYLRNKNANTKYNYWHSYLKDNHDLEKNFKYSNISLWSVFIGMWAPLDIFAMSENTFSPDIERKLITNRVLRIIRLLKEGNSNSKVKLSKKPRPHIAFIAFEQRQIECFIESIKLLQEKDTQFTIITTIFPSKKWDPKLNIDYQRVACIENFSPLYVYPKVFLNYLRIKKWLSNIKKFYSLDQDYGELKCIIWNIENRLLKILIEIESASQLLNIIKPTVITGADISDPRSRAIFLVGKREKIPNYHMTYGYFCYHCFEEMYLAADKKLVYSNNHKELIKKNFSIPNDRIEELGCPRFDKLFKLRKNYNTKISSINTICLGSQPCGNSQYRIFTRKFKRKVLANFISNILKNYETKKNTRIKILFKPHPDETVEEVKEFERLANYAGIEYEIISNIDFANVVSEVDLFVTFYSALSLEFTIIGIPVCFLISVENIPILNAMCKIGIAAEISKPDDFYLFTKMLTTDYNSVNKSVNDFLRDEFTIVDGTSSVQLVRKLLNN